MLIPDTPMTTIRPTTTGAANRSELRPRSGNHDLPESLGSSTDVTLSPVAAHAVNEANIRSVTAVSNRNKLWMNSATRSPAMIG